jgi:hypothetical protein
MEEGGEGGEDGEDGEGSADDGRARSMHDIQRMSGYYMLDHGGGGTDKGAGGNGRGTSAKQREVKAKLERQTKVAARREVKAKVKAKTKALAIAKAVERMEGELYGDWTSVDTRPDIESDDEDLEGWSQQLASSLSSSVGEVGRSTFSTSLRMSEYMLEQGEQSGKHVLSPKPPISRQVSVDEDAAAAEAAWIKAKEEEAERQEQEEEREYLQELRLKKSKTGS